MQSGETVLAFDPPSKESSVKSPRFQTDIVLISHNHNGHNGYQTLSGKKDGVEPFVIDGPGEYEIGDVHVMGVKSFHDTDGGKKHGLNTIYSATLEDINICHLGDFGEKDLSSGVKEIVSGVDILFVPIGGDTVLGPQKAAQIVSQIGPKIIIPMHYGDPKQGGGKNDTLKSFLGEFGSESAKPVDKLTTKKKDILLVKEKMRVIVLGSV